MRVKLFHAPPATGPIWRKSAGPHERLEAAVNEWLAANPTVRVVHAQHQVLGGNGWSAVQHYATIWYEDAAEPGSASAGGA